MIVSSLCEYYNYNEDLLPSVGYSKVKIQYLVMLTPDGKIDDIISLKKEKRSKDNKKIIKYPAFEFPFRTEKTCMDANIIEHRAKYLFGFCDLKDGEFVVEKIFFECFKKATIEFFKDIQSPLAKAYYNFASNWVPEENTKNQLLLKMGKDCLSKYCAFALSGRPDIYLNDDAAVREKWDKAFAAKILKENNVVAQCAILGKKLPIARIHYKIKGLKGGLSSGCTFVCFNSNAQESYGKTQSYNSNISHIAMSEYTSAFNYLLEDADDKNVSHKTTIGDMTIVHFALAKDKEAYQQLCYVNNNIFAESSDEPSIKNIEKEVGESFELLSKGKVSAFEIEKSDLVEYCIFGVIANESRITQRFFYRNTFGVLRRNVERFNEDFAIGNSTKAPAIGAILKQLLPCKKDDSKEQEKGNSKKNEDKKESKQTIPPDLCESLFMAMLQGSPFPQKLFQTVVRRIKTDVYKSDWFINDTRAGLVKACLNRNYKKDKEKIKVALDTQNKTPAYLCGRLFAVLEKIQQISQDGKETNRSIKNTFFSSACATPAVVFPKVIKLSNVHQEKRSDGLMFYYSTLIGEIIDGLEGEFPKTLSLEEQGTFIIGYYHQKNYKTKEDKSKEENITEEN